MRDLKYYLYVSDSKLTMLYDQMPEKTRSKLAAELKIDLKVISAMVKKGEGQQNHFSKLRLLTEYIHEAEKSVPSSFPENTSRVLWTCGGGSGERTGLFPNNASFTSQGSPGRQQ